MRKILLGSALALMMPMAAVGKDHKPACATITIPVTAKGKATRKGVYRTCAVKAYWDGFSVTDEDRHYIAHGLVKMGTFKTGDAGLDKGLSAAFAKALPMGIGSDSLPLTMKDWHSSKWQQWNAKGRQQSPHSTWVSGRLVNAPSITRVVVEDGRRIAIITTKLSRKIAGVKNPEGITLGDHFTVELRLDINALDEI